jgi:hypothetical protein
MLQRGLGLADFVNIVMIFGTYWLAEQLKDSVPWSKLDSYLA